MSLYGRVWKMHCNKEFTKQLFPKPIASYTSHPSIRQIVLVMRLAQMPDHSLDAYPLLVWNCNMKS